MSTITALTVRDGSEATVQFGTAFSQNGICHCNAVLRMARSATPNGTQSLMLIDGITSTRPLYKVGGSTSTGKVLNIDVNLSNGGRIGYGGSGGFAGSLPAGELIWINFAIPI